MPISSLEGQEISCLSHKVSNCTYSYMLTQWHIREKKLLFKRLIAVEIQMLVIVGSMEVREISTITVNIFWFINIKNQPLVSLIFRLSSLRLGHDVWVRPPIAILSVHIVHWLVHWLPMHKYRNQSSLRMFRNGI